MNWSYGEKCCPVRSRDAAPGYTSLTASTKPPPKSPSLLRMANNSSARVGWVYFQTASSPACRSGMWQRSMLSAQPSLHASPFRTWSKASEVWKRIFQSLRTVVVFVERKPRQMEEYFCGVTDAKLSNIAQRNVSVLTGRSIRRHANQRNEV